MGLPAAIDGLGFLWGTVTLVLGYIFSLFTALFVLEALRLTNPKAHFFKLSKELLGPASVVLVLSIVLASYGALTAYISGIAATLSPVLGVDESILAFVVWLTLSILVYGGLKLSGRAEQWLGVFMLLLFGPIIVLCIPHIQYFRGTLTQRFFPALQIALFAFFAHTIIPEVYRGLGSFGKALKAIFTAFTITGIIYISFALAVLGVLGPEAEEVATEGLARILDPIFVPFLILFPLLTMTTSFIGVGTGQKDMLSEICGDFGPILALVPPIVVYFLYPGFLSNIFIASFGLVIAGGILPPLLLVSARIRTKSQILPVSNLFALLLLVVMAGLFVANLLFGTL